MRTTSPSRAKRPTTARKAKADMNLETERCTLRAVTKDDRHDLHQLYASKDVRRFLGGVADEKTFPKRFDDMVRKSGDHWVIRLKDNNEFVGVVALRDHDNGQDREISYQLLKIFWSKGLAGEAVAAVMDHAANTLKLPALVAETQDANEPSKKLLKKLGMSFDGTLMRHGEKQAVFRKIFTQD